MRYNTNMISSEHEPGGPISFQEAAERLSENDGLILARDSIRVVHEGRVIREILAHYEDLTRNTQESDGSHRGKLITGAFRAAALDTLSEMGSRPRSTYPLMRVINNEEEERQATEVMDIAQLIAMNLLPVYAREDTSTKSGEELSLDMSVVMRDMAARVGLDPAKVVLIDDSEARPLDGLIRVRETHPSAQPNEFPESDELSIDRRGEAMLSLLQMDLAKVFATHRHKITDGIEGHVEVVLRLTNQPDLQATILSLIDLVEYHHLNLHYSKGMTLIDEEGATFTLVDDSFALRFGLATEKTLDMAVYNAYLAAVEIFRRMD